MVRHVSAGDITPGRHAGLFLLNTTRTVPCTVPGDSCAAAYGPVTQRRPALLRYANRQEVDMSTPGKSISRNSMPSNGMSNDSMRNDSMPNGSRSIRTPLLAAALAMSTLALAGCATSGGSSGYTGSGYGSSQTACYDCGTVVRIEEGSGSRTPNATGAVVGAVIGGLAAREIADNKTDSEGRKNTATVAGAAAGGVIGNAIQNRAGTGYNIFVKMRDGREVVVSQDDLNGIAVGSRVEVRNGRARLI
jgi:outer membrane lipoprotein SlyB